MMFPTRLFDWVKILGDITRDDTLTHYLIAWDYPPSGFIDIYRKRKVNQIDFDIKCLIYIVFSKRQVSI